MKPGPIMPPIKVDCPGPCPTWHAWLDVGLRHGARRVDDAGLLGGVLIVGGVALFRALGGSLGGRGQGTPIDVLKRRYAGGQITREQYEQMRKDLE